MNNLNLATRLLLIAQIINGFTSQKTPNVVIILLDDVGYGDFGFTGQPSHETVQIDKRAAQGMIFTDMYSASPLCSPSRAAMLTGRLPPRNGFYTTNQPGRNAYTPQNIVHGINSTEVLLSELLQKAGYNTKLIGKWHLGHKLEYMPLQHGFDEYLGSTNVHFGPYNDKDTPNIPIFEGNKMIGRYYEDFPIEQVHHTANITQMYAQAAVEFISRNRTEPFFLYFAPDNTHGPTYKDVKYLGKSRRNCSYGDSLLEIDDVVERIFTAIEENEHIANNTVVFFSSDNGAARQSGIEGGSNFPLLCGKETTMEGGMREPSFIWWPGKIADRSYNRGPAMLTDLFATILDLVGISPPDDRNYDSNSLSKAMFENFENMSRPVFYWRGDRLMAVRVGQYKGHFWTWANGHDEYDIGIDFCPGEDVKGLTTRVPQNYTIEPMIFNLARDTGERFALANHTEEYKAARDLLVQEYDEHLRTMDYAVPALNDCDVAAQHWAPPGCDLLGKCLPVPPSNPVKCDWPH